MPATRPAQVLPLIGWTPSGAPPGRHDGGGRCRALLGGPFRSAAAESGCDECAGKGLSDIPRISKHLLTSPIWTFWVGLTQTALTALRCRIPPYTESRQRAARAAGPASAPGSALRRPTRRTPGRTGSARRSRPLGRHASRYSTSRVPRHPLSGSRPPRSRALPAVASHEIGFADPRPGDHSPGFGAYEQDGPD